MRRLGRLWWRFLFLGFGTTCSLSNFATKFLSSTFVVTICISLLMLAFSSSFQTRSFTRLLNGPKAGLCVDQWPLLFTVCVRSRRSRTILIFVFCIIWIFNFEGVNKLRADDIEFYVAVAKIASSVSHDKVLICDALIALRIIDHLRAIKYGILLFSRSMLEG